MLSLRLHGRKKREEGKRGKVSKEEERREAPVNIPSKSLPRFASVGRPPNAEVIEDAEEARLNESGGGGAVAGDANEKDEGSGWRRGAWAVWLEKAGGEVNWGMTLRRLRAASGLT